MTQSAYLKVAAGRRWTPSVTILKDYPDAWQVQVGDTLLNISKRDASIGWMSDWSDATEMERAGWITSKCYGPSTYNHITLFWAAQDQLFRAVRRWNFTGE